MAPRITVVVPARDEERLLPGTLLAIRRQSFDDYELVVVANACIDRTAEIAAAHGRVIESAEPGVSQARNIGAAAARGELLLFLDADVVLPAGALQTVADRFMATDAVGTFEARPSGSRVWYRILFSLRNLLFRTGAYQSAWPAIVCRRSLFDRIGGFDLRRETQELRDLVRRLKAFGGYRFLRVPVCISIRRWERWGLLRLSRYWLVAFLGGFSGKYDGGGYGGVR